MFVFKRQSVIASALAFIFLASSFASAAPYDPAQLDFRLRTTDGGEISSDMLRGDVVVLAFGAMWLQALSKAQMQGVQEVADEFGARQVRVYWVSTDSDKQQSRNYASDEQLRTFARKQGLKVAVLRDPDGVLFKQMNVPGNQLPAIVIFNRRGEVSGAPIGGIDPKRKLVEEIAPRLNSLLNEQ